MKIIKDVTGQTTISATPITKSCGTLIFATSKEFTEISDETISIVVERANTDNVYIATKVNLKDFMLLNLLNNDDKLLGAYAPESYKCVAMLELGVDAGLMLADTDKIQVTIDKATAASTYALWAVEEFEVTSAFIDYEVKGIADYETDKTIDVSQYSAAVFKLDGEISEIGLHAGDVELRYTPFELRCLSLQEMPFIDALKGGAAGTLPVDRLLIPLFGIDQITVYKGATGSASLLFTTIAELGSARPNKVGSTSNAYTPVRNINVAAAAKKVLELSRDNVVRNELLDMSHGVLPSFRKR